MNYQEENACFDNYAYHHSETLEMNRRTPGQSSMFRTAPLPSSYQQELSDSSDVWRNWSQPEVIQMITIGRVNSELGPRIINMNPYENSRGCVNPGFEPIEDESYSSASSLYDWHSDQDPSFIPNVHGDDDISNQELAMARRRRSTGTGSLSAGLRFSQFVNSQQEISTGEKEEQREFIAELVALSPNERAKAIQELTVSMDKKRKIRNQVYLEIGPKSMKADYQIACCTQLLTNISSSLRHFCETMTEILYSIHPWHRSLKIIGGMFGTGVLSYFTFLKWLLMFNVFSFLINFSFITIPQFFALDPNNLTFTGLELLTGAGYFTQTVFYYGFYTNASIQASPSAAMYNMQLAYFLTFGFYMLICFLYLVYSIARSFNENFTIGTSSGEAAWLLCSWDFNITNEKTVQLKKTSLSTQLKEMLSEKTRYKRQLTRKQKIVRCLIHLIAWIISLGTTVGCCVGVYFYSKSNFQIIQKDATKEELQKQASTLFLPFLVASINLFIPLFFSFLGLMERFKYPWHEIYVLIIRNILLKMSITGVLCYYWLVIVAEVMECWETFVGQDLYRLVVTDFIFSLFSSFFGEFIRSVIGRYCWPKLGIPEFDIARNVLALIHAQTLGWVGLFFAPLLPAIQIIKFFITFHVKRVSLMMNCQPPRIAWRASHMTTIFIFLLFFPAFIGVLCLIGVTVWRSKPSEFCGPFRGLSVPYSAVSRFIHGPIRQLEWLGWIYNKLIVNPLFFFILTIIVFAIIYLYWQIIDGHKMMAKLLQERIINEGKDKAYLLQKLTALKMREVSNETKTKSSTEPYMQLEERRGIHQYSPDLTEEHGFGSQWRNNKVHPGLDEEFVPTSNTELPNVTSEHEREDQGHNPNAREEAGSALALALAAKRQAEQQDY
ncbi:transmembrane channel-like protein 5 isoform X1 [Mobula hypostoma]|uniref:transmembrane channel-like protein 5 isoform X1 n=2 Tax=Mobula hypostoma TaxID=723540 RepID=UPI002FC2A51E